MLQLFKMSTETLPNMPEIFEGRIDNLQLRPVSDHLYEVCSNTKDFDRGHYYWNVVLVVYGAPGAGKDTFVETLLSAQSDLKFDRPKTVTTRSPRPQEIKNDPYIRMTDKEFMDAYRNGQFIEINQHESDGGVKKYGSLKSEVARVLEDGAIPLLRVDPNGAKSLLRVAASGEFPFEKSLLVNFCIIPPDIDTIMERLLSRQKESMSDKEAREMIAARMPQVLRDVHFESAHYIGINRTSEIEKLCDEVIDLLKKLTNERLQEIV